MKRLWLAAVLALCAVANSRAQDFTNVVSPAPRRFTSGAGATLTNDSASLFSELRAPALTSDALAFAPHNAPEASAPEAEPAAPEPKFGYGTRDDFRWQLGLGISLVRFRSSHFYATGVGTSTSLSYFTNEWLAVEGEITTAFAPTIYQDEHVKYVSYGAGPMIAWRQRKWEPWMHALFGGVHVLPQTAGNSQNAFGLQVGTGVDYRFYPHLSGRLELDWVRSHLFSQWQDSVQTALELVLHF
jgi:opacity protein-like surface antigen